MRIPALFGVILVLAGCSSQPDNPLIRAARSGNRAAITALVKAGADPNQRWDVNDWTPLMHAIHKSRKGSVEALIDAGADVNATSGKGITPLMMAAGYGSTSIVELLLDKGADAYAETSNGDSALASAVGGVPDIDKFTVGKCQTATVQALLKKAPELKLKDNFYGRAARMAARVAGCTEVLDLIERKHSASSQRVFTGSRVK